METNDSRRASFVEIREERFWSSFYRAPVGMTTIVVIPTRNRRKRWVYM